MACIAGIMKYKTVHTVTYYIHKQVLIKWGSGNVVTENYEALGILHGLEKFHNYCFAREVYIITDHKPLVTILSKDVTMLSQWLQCIML